jgi:hypothetical protein
MGTSPISLANCTKYPHCFIRFEFCRACFSAVFQGVCLDDSNDIFFLQWVVSAVPFAHAQQDAGPAFTACPHPTPVTLPAQIFTSDCSLSCKSFPSAVVRLPPHPRPRCPNSSTLEAVVFMLLICAAECCANRTQLLLHLFVASPEVGVRV